MGISGELRYYVEAIVQDAGDNGCTIREIKQELINRGVVSATSSLTNNTIRECLIDFYKVRFGDPDQQLIGLKEGPQREIRYWIRKTSDLLPARKGYVPKPPGEARK